MSRSSGAFALAAAAAVGFAAHAAVASFTGAQAPRQIVKTTTYQFHHMGVPTTQVREGEIYSSRYDMYSSGGRDSEFRVEWHRFGAGSTLPPLVKTMPHVGFKVDSIDEAIKGRKVIFGPYYPFPNFRVAMIEDHGAPIEFIETSLSDEEVWYGSKKGTFLYPEK